MKFDVVKKGYDKTQVESYIRDITNENNQVVTDLKTEIEELKKQNDELSQKLGEYDKKKDEIFVAFVEAQETSAKLKSKAEKRFEEEMERLQLFQQKWTNYAKDVVKELAEQEAQKFEQASEKFKEILALYSKDVKVLQPKEQAEKPVQDKTFDPLKKVTKFLNNFEDVEVQKPVQPVVQPVVEQVVETKAEPVEEKDEDVTKAPLEVESVAEELVDEKQVESVVVQPPEKQDSIKEKVQKLFEEEDKAALEMEANDISQNDIFNVQQSLEDLCKELGLIE
ncbi:MAG: DivIVA domain-containing protein [Clostridia bacterium]|nr:DivIVA domain-containing protein [Clostridia bacterium]